MDIKNIKPNNYDSTNWSSEERELDEKANSFWSSKRKQVAKNYHTRAETLDRLANDKNSNVRVEVAINPSASPETLERLAHDKNFNTRLRVFNNPSTNSKTLDVFASDKDELIRQKVAAKTSASTEALDKLVNDSKFDVRIAALKNPSTSPETLNKLANDWDVHVRYCVASNFNTPYETLRRLSNDTGSCDMEVGHFESESSKVTREKPNWEAEGAAGRPMESTTTITTQKWVHEGWTRYSISEAATGTLNMLEEIVLKYCNKNQGRLKNDTDVNVRCSFASNPMTPPEILRGLANDTMVNVRYYVASNHNTPCETLQELSPDAGSYDEEIGHFEFSKFDVHRLSPTTYSLAMGIGHPESKPEREITSIILIEPKEYITNSIWIHEGWEHHSISDAAMGTLNKLEKKEAKGHVPIPVVLANDENYEKPSAVEPISLLCPNCHESIEDSVLVANHFKCPTCGKPVVQCNYHEAAAVTRCSKCGRYLCEKCTYTNKERDYCQSCYSEDTRDADKFAGHNSDVPQDSRSDRSIGGGGGSGSNDGGGGGRVEWSVGSRVAFIIIPLAAIIIILVGIFLNWVWTVAVMLAGMAVGVVLYIIVKEYMIIKERRLHQRNRK